MGIFDALSVPADAAVRVPTGVPLGYPGAGLAMPPSVKPTVLPVKPRLRPMPAAADGMVPDAAANARGTPDSVPRIGPLATDKRENPDAGKKKLFSNSGYWQDVAAGIQSVPGNAGPISSFALGFAGAVTGSASRKTADALTAAKQKQQDIENARADATAARDDRRLAIDENRYKDDTSFTKDGRLTAAGRLKINDAVIAYTKLIMPNGGRPSADEQRAIDAERQRLTDDIMGGGAAAPRDTSAPSSTVSSGPIKLNQPAAGHEPSDTAAPRPAEVTGSGTQTDPYRAANFTDTQEGIAAVRATVPVGGYYDVVDPATGRIIHAQRDY